MKAISLLQPWATLWMLGIKELETRSWKTNYRGPLMVHASAASSQEGRDLYESACIQALIRARVLPQFFALLPKGCILGQLNITGCTQMDLSFIRATPTIELLLGDYAPGRFAWSAEERVIFKEPVKCQGALSIWSVLPQIAALCIEPLLIGR
jgi:hypothetical protein